MSASKEMRAQAKRLREFARMSELLALAQTDPDKLARKLLNEQKARYKRKMNAQLLKALRGK